jgi:hypothetical protein
MGKVIFNTGLLASLLGIVCIYQSCAKAKFGANFEGSGINQLGTGVTVVCDPFSPSPGCTPPPPGGGPTPGLIGNVYTYPNGTKVDDYINLGKKLPVLVQLSALDIPVRSWTTGFPGPHGGVLDASGNLLIEYFALDLGGFFQAPASLPEDDYQFAMNSDDGSILYFDGKETVNDDGTHPMQWKCAPAALTLKHADNHKMRLKYYQGPRVEIGLQVYLRPWSKRGRPCDASGGWQIIPAAGLTH